MLLRTRLGCLWLSSVLLLAACGGQGALTLAPESELPRFLAASAPRVREAYRFAHANHRALATVPCYCGCGKMGHDSNLACFIEEGAEVAKIVTFDEHAAGCGICVDIAQDVMRLTREGKPASEIRAYVDATYSSFGPATDTPLP